jgi:hypothetical protein
MNLSPISPGTGEDMGSGYVRITNSATALTGRPA